MKSLKNFTNDNGKLYLLRNRPFLSLKVDHLFLKGLGYMHLKKKNTTCQIIPSNYFLNYHEYVYWFYTFTVMGLL